MFRVKVKNKDTGQSLLAWEDFTQNDGKYGLFSDFECEHQLDVDKYEVDDDYEFGYGISCGNGWYSLISPIIDYVEEYNSNYPKEEEQIRILDIKEKWGALRIYVWSGTKELYDMIDKAEKDSTHTCEFCGSTIDVGHTSGYVMTVCHDCVKAMAIKNNRTYRWRDLYINEEYLISPDEKDLLMPVESEKQ